MKKVIVLLVLFCFYSCTSEKKVEQLSGEEKTQIRQELTDSLTAVFRNELLTQEQQLKLQIDSVTELLTVKSPELKVYQTQIKQYKATINNLNQKLKTLTQEGLNQDSLVIELGKLTDRNKTLIREKDQYLDQVKSLETENNRLKSELTSLKKKGAEKASIKEANRYKVEGNAVSRLKSEEGRGFVVYKVDPTKSEVRLFWRDAKRELYDNFANYQKDLVEQGELLLFATNGGMYQQDKSPQGLYIENGKTIQKADTKKEGYGNFYMQPNGIFLINDKGEPYVIKTQDLRGYEKKGIRYATQSGPMLLTNGKMNLKFMEDSPNFHIRSGVGVNDQGELVFIISETRVRFYELAKAFEAMGCKNALYLDGAISQTYLPEVDRLDTGGGFGVMIGVSQKN